MPSSVQVKTLIAGQTVVTISTKDSIQQALEKLSNKNITSAPVIDEEGKIRGFVDVVDLVAFLVKVATKELKSNVSTASTKLTTDDIGVISNRAATFYVSSILEILGQFPRHDPYYPLHEEQTLKDAIQIFLKGVHRIAVTDVHNKITGILTQSNIINWLSQEPSRLGLKAQTEVTKLNTKFKTTLVSVAPDTVTIDAFQTMNEKNVTALAIVDKNGVLQGALSATDLKGIKDLQFFRLLLPVSEFLQEVRKTQNKTGTYVVTVNTNSDLKTAVTRLAHEHVHRVFVVDEHNKPVAVLSDTDVLREVYSTA